MLKKFNYALNHSRVGVIWGISLVMLLLSIFVWIMPEGSENYILSKDQMITFLLAYGTIFSFIVSTYILIKGDYKQLLNVTYICPTARKYMNEQEINEIEGGN